MFSNLRQSVPVQSFSFKATVSPTLMSQFETDRQCTHVTRQHVLGRCEVSRLKSLVSEARSLLETTATPTASDLASIAVETLRVRAWSNPTLTSHQS